ncbi:MAG: CAP domain-containing protein [Ramlibacter sp.]
MSRKTMTAAGCHLWVGLAIATLAGCASAPPPSGESTATLAGPPGAALAVGCNAATLRQSVLQRVNEARASGQVCGEAKQPAAKPLAWQPALAAAAARRASDMAQRGLGAPDARMLDQRLRQEGYRPVSAQESSAAGDYTSDTVAQTWLSYQRQCTALMNPAYTEVGAGCASAPNTEWGHYWTVVVAKPGEASGARAAAKPKAKTGASAKPSVPSAAKTRKAATKASARKCSTAGCSKANPAVR